MKYNRIFIVIPTGVFFLLFFNGCMTLMVGEMDDALPQGKGVLKAGLGFETETVALKNEAVLSEGITYTDKYLHPSVKIKLRYGLNNHTDITGTGWYTAGSGIGIAAT